MDIQRVKKLEQLREDLATKLTQVKSIINENMTRLRRGQTVKHPDCGLGHVIRITESYILVDWFDGGKQKLSHIKGSKIQVVSESLSFLVEDEMEKAKLTLAAQEIRDGLMKCMKIINDLQMENLMPIVDNITSAFGPEKSQAFETTVSGALDTAMHTVKSCKDQIQNAILALEGNSIMNDMAMNAGGDTMGMADQGNDMENPDGENHDDLAKWEDSEEGKDEFDGDEAASGPEDEPLGRAKKESAESKGKLIKEKQTCKSDVKKKVNETNPSEPSVDPKIAALEKSLQKVNDRLSKLESAGPDGIEFDSKYVNGEYIIFEKISQTRVYSYDSGGKTLSMIDQLNHNKKRSYDLVKGKLQDILMDLEYDLKIAKGEWTVESASFDQKKKFVVNENDPSLNDGSISAGQQAYIMWLDGQHTPREASDMVSENTGIPSDVIYEMLMQKISSDNQTTEDASNNNVSLTENQDTPEDVFEKLIESYLWDLWTRNNDHDVFNRNVDKFVEYVCKDPNLVAEKLGKKYIGEHFIWELPVLEESVDDIVLEELSTKLLAQNKLSKLIHQTTSIYNAKYESLTPNFLSRLIAEASLNPKKYSVAMAFETFGESYIKTVDSQKIFEADPNLMKTLASVVDNIAQQKQPKTPTPNASKPTTEKDVADKLSKMSGKPVRPDEVKKALQDLDEEEESHPDDTKSALLNVGFIETESGFVRDHSEIDPIETLESMGFKVREYGERNPETKLRTVVMESPSGDQIQIIIDYSNETGGYEARIKSNVQENANAPIMKTDKWGQFKGEPHSTDYNNPKRKDKVNAISDEMKDKQKASRLDTSRKNKMDGEDKGLPELGTVKKPKKKAGKSGNNGLKGSAAERNARDSNPAGGEVPSTTKQHKAKVTDQNYIFQ